MVGFMAVYTFLDILVRDGQGYDRTMRFRIKPATFGSTTIPSTVKIKAVVNAIFGTATPSNSIVRGWQVVVYDNDPTGAVGGAGGSATSQAGRTRSGATEYIEEIPGLDKGIVSFDSSNSNSIVVVGAMWDAIRAALADTDIAIGALPPAAYAATAETDIIRSATLYDGKRAPKRIR